GRGRSFSIAITRVRAPTSSGRAARSRNSSASRKSCCSRASRRFIAAVLRKRVACSPRPSTGAHPLKKRWRCWAGWTGSSSARDTLTDLPLFGSIPDDEPLITKPSPPRPPLAVRRATPEVPRLRVDQPRMQLFDLTLDANDRSPVSSAERSQDLKHAVSWAPGDLHERARDAEVCARFVAVVIDLLILT